MDNVVQVQNLNFCIAEISKDKTSTVCSSNGERIVGNGIDE